MLQYSLPISASVGKDNDDYFGQSIAMRKDAFVIRTPIPTSIISSNPSPTDSLPSTASSKHLRSPYISSRQTSSPVSLPSARPLSSKIPSDSRSVSSALEDVFFPGDLVGQGSLLQGEVLRLVSIGITPRPADLQDFEEPAKEFEVVRRLGAGSYAVVYLVREVLYRPPPSDDGHVSTFGQMDIDDSSRPSTVYGREYAIKCLSKANLDEEALVAQMTEVTIHQSLRSHPNIVTLHRTLETSSFLLLLLEYVPGEDLFYFLEQARDHYDADPPNSTTDSRTPPTPSLLSTLNPSQLLSRTRLRLISSMFSQMCDAVAACHAQQVYHRDIKPENFIVTDGWSTAPDGRRERKVVVKLTDFGLSSIDFESSDMDCGSAPYMSYECRNNVAPTYRPRAADVWSLGIVLINMLYHYNPWTDTAHGACSSFDFFRQHPVNFFMHRFAGMTRPVAELLANRVFNVLDDPSDDSKRISAAEFGTWVKDLPDLLGDHHRPPSASHKRVISTSSTHGHPISSSTPASHRPSSRHASGMSTAIRTPAMQPRSLSRAPSFGPAYERPEASELSTVIDQEVEEQEEEQEEAGMTSRSTSTNKRRKRGARKGKGAIATTPTTPKDDTLVTLAVASESLAREISKASRASSRMSVASDGTKQSTESARSRRKQQSLEPVSMFAVPTPLCSGNKSRPPSPSASTSTSFTSISSPFTPSVPSLPAAFASIPLASTTVPPVPALPATVSTSSVSVPSVTKKPSKWKLSLGKSKGSSIISGGRVSPVEEVSPPASIDLHSEGSSYVQQQPQQQTHKPAQQQPMSATASNVTSLIMGLSAAPTPHSAPAVATQTDDAASTWSRGRRSRGSPSRSPAPDDASHVSPSPQRWARESDRRAISPNSTRSGRPLASSASSMASGNWRSSMSTTSSAGTSTSAFTRYSNSSVRSVSTAATSVSAQSWRTNNSKSGISTTSLPHNGHPPLPKNVKVMDGVPWELMELPRQQHPNPVGDIFGQPPARKQRTRKPKDLKLEPINERPLASAAKKSPETQRRMDASTSTTDLSAQGIGRDDVDGPKKVQKGQINALAKMLSALRR